jgi:hypothetical protein
MKTIPSLAGKIAVVTGASRGASLYSDPQLMSKSGSVVIAAEAALEYGFKDFNGNQPPSLREQKGSPRPFFTKS